MLNSEHHAAPATTLTDDEWDVYVEDALGHYAQTSMWAEVKATVGWTRERVGVMRDGQLVAGVQALLRSIPVIGPVAVVPSAALASMSDPALDAVLDELLRLCARKRVVWLKLQPDSRQSQDPQGLERLLHRHRFVRSDVRAALLASMRVELSPDPARVMASMRSGLRANIRKALRKGSVVVREGNEHDLATFTDLMAGTAARQSGMRLFPQTYYRQAWRAFTARGRGRLMLAEHEGQPLSAILLVTYGDTCEYLYGGWNRERADLHPNEFLQWSAIEWACEQGFRWYDLGAIDPVIATRVQAGERVPTDGASGQTRYKLGFNGQPLFSPPAYDQTGWRMLRPAVRLLAPRLKLAYPAVDRIRGLAR